MGTTSMTGASRGLGREAAEHLLRHHPDQHLLVFNRRPGLAAELAASTGNDNVSEVLCDLASFADIRRAAAEVDRPLDGFLGNAGLQMATTDKHTADGVEMTFGVNVLAYHLLLNLLRPRFTNPARVIIVGSDVHDSAHNSMGLIPPPRWTDPRELARPREGGGREGRRAYATSKLGVVYLVHALRRRLPEGVDVYSYNPGLVPDTELSRDAGRFGRAAFRTIGKALVTLPIATTADRAGRLLAETMTGPRPGESGSYISRGEVIPSSSESYDERREEELWAVADELCGLTADGTTRTPRRSA
ncbi:NAD(P)-dependent dehydrogenase (short-subunit alcohol dehydrogenase family) [Saccharothrix carnea]|uniref:NAD(P)-dependent dehydrogenase (Short-subunit alcohol dehydrogenase family) n=1 Tax=Saccharothrix carnea TaxID=1280637 RepID=A0A2P8IGY3_SACCR|nr:SDR family NAD(P)-dependent oxidoreductase [Saccharothrix carnea]PSL57714.1 NAD(P)-dependent dehydrogenase (short-subunit alcohol dehydrogenase family) [Saccharothrix carnea]